MKVKIKLSHFRALSLARAGKKEMRWFLQGIWLDFAKNRVMATNSHLMMVTLPNYGMVIETAPTQHAYLNIPAAAVEQFLKISGKHADFLIIESENETDAVITDGTVRVHFTFDKSKMPNISEAERENSFADNQTAINDLVYCRNLRENLLQLEKFVRNSMILFNFYEQTQGFIQDAETAAAALLQEAQLRDGSPNQRRSLLQPLNWLNALIYVLTQYTPGSLLLQVARYGTGRQLRNAYVSFYETPKAVRESTIRIIRGESLRTLAKEYGMKEPELRLCVLQAAKYLYRIGECLTDTYGLQPAQGIPDLRDSAWQPLGQSQNLKAAARMGYEITEEFETTYGIVATLELAKRERALNEKLRKTH